MILPFLETLEIRGIEYVSWKNNHEIDKVLSGNSDLDIYVPLNYKNVFVETLEALGWIEVINPVSQYPYIHHYYAIDKDLNVYHLHVYYKIITGESWLKEYELPIGEFLINNRYKHPSGIYILNGYAQSYLFAIRHFLKGSSFFSRKLYKRELLSYQEEWDLCKGEFRPQENIGEINLSKYIDCSGLDSKLSLPTKRAANKFRNDFSKYLRVQGSNLSFLRFNHFISRFLNKILYKRKKILPCKGFILVFSGADGVGKSTMSESISDTYKKFLTVRNVQLGRPQSKFIELLRSALNKQDKKYRFNTSNHKNTSLKKAISAVYLAYLRYKEARIALSYSKKKYLIISDRWPTQELYKMDGPKLDKYSLQGVKRKLAILEGWFYKKIEKANLCIVLTVPIDVAIDRNRKRDKKGKETDEEIVQRHTENMQHLPKAEKIIRFDNNGELEIKRFELIKLIQGNLIRLKKTNDN